MPFSRVGVMPQPTRKKEQHASSRSLFKGRGGRQKGITMEDLKKQTALRLAQEQQQKNHDLTSTVHGTAIGDRVSVPYNGLPGSSGMVSVGLEGEHYNYAAHLENPRNTPVTAGPYFDPSSTNKPAGRKKSSRDMIAPLKPSQNLSVPKSPSRFQSDQLDRYIMAPSVPALPTNPLVVACGTVGFDAPPQSQHATHPSSKSKLPHGLTVHELKEMTKARLQAEAAERQEPEKQHLNSYEQEQQQQQQRINLPQTEKAENRVNSILASEAGRSLFVHPQIGLPESSVPALVQVHQLRSDKKQHQGTRHSAQTSPRPPGFQHYHVSVSPFNDNRNVVEQARGGLGMNRETYQQDTMLEAWESASVNSHNSTVVSDYLNSESAFSLAVSGGFPSQVEDASSATVRRSRSYPVGSAFAGAPEIPSYETTPTSVSSPGMSYYDSSLETNRQRAMTLSPRPVLSLLHEDRPVFNSEELVMPSFSSASRRPLHARGRISYSPLVAMGFSSESLERFGQHSPGVIGSNVLENSNRPRTSSAVSLPAISHTAEEFALDRSIISPPAATLSSTRNLFRNNTYTENMIGSPGLYHGENTKTSGVSSVFRDSSSSQGLKGVSAPPGLGTNQEIASSGMCSRVESADSFENQIQISSWVSAGCDMFGASTGFIECTGDDFLSGDLASILKLSGAEEKGDVLTQMSNSPDINDLPSLQEQESRNSFF